MTKAPENDYLSRSKGRGTSWRAVLAVLDGLETERTAKCQGLRLDIPAGYGSQERSARWRGHPERNAGLPAGEIIAKATFFNLHYQYLAAVPQKSEARIQHNGTEFSLRPHNGTKNCDIPRGCALSAALPDSRSVERSPEARRSWERAAKRRKTCCPGRPRFHAHRPPALPRCAWR